MAEPVPGAAPDSPPSGVPPAPVAVFGRREAAALAAVAVLALVFRLAGFVGVYHEDDLDYLDQAHLIASGTFHPDVANPWSVRLAFLGPVAACLAAFGVSEFSAMFYMLVCGIGEVLVAYRLARRWGPACAFLCALFVATNPLSVFFSTTGRSDVPMAFWMGLSAMLFMEGQPDGAPLRPWRLAGAGAALALAFAHVERALFLAPFFPLYAWGVRRSLRPVLWSLAGAAAVVAVEGLVMTAVGGDPLLRIRSTLGGDTHHYRETILVNLRMRGGDLTGRWWTDLPDFLFNPLQPLAPWAGLLGWGAVFGIGWSLRAGGWRRTWPFAAWWGIFLLAWNFWPYRLRPYLPAVFLEARHFTPLAIPAGALLAWALVGLAGRRRWALIASAVALAGVHGFAVSVLAREPAAWMDPIRRAHAFLQTCPGERVATDHRTVRRLQFLAGYRPVRPWTNYQSDPRPFRDGLVVVNDFWVQSLESQYGYRMPEAVHAPPPSWREVFRTEIPAVRSLRAALFGLPAPDPVPRSLRIYRITGDE